MRAPRRNDAPPRGWVLAKSRDNGRRNDGRGGDPDGRGGRCGGDRGHLPPVRHGRRDVVRGDAARAPPRWRDASTPCSRWRPGSVALDDGGRPDRLRLRLATRRARGVPVVRRRRPSTSAPGTTAAGSDARSMGRSSRCCACRGSTSRTPASRCRTRPASGCTNHSAFVPVGVYPAVGWKFGAWRDVGWWHLPLQERPATPAPPLPLAEAQKLPSWPAALR